MSGFRPPGRDEPQRPVPVVARRPGRSGRSTAVVIPVGHRFKVDRPAPEDPSRRDEEIPELVHGRPEDGVVVPLDGPDVDPDTTSTTGRRRRRRRRSQERPDDIQVLVDVGGGVDEKARDLQHVWYERMGETANQRSESHPSTSKP